MLYKNKRFLVFDLLAVILSILFFMILSGCNRPAEVREFLGSGIKPASANFSVQGNSFTASPTAVNFSINVVSFASTFSEDVTWKMKITGKLSGAVKTIEGTSNNLNAANATWDGNSSNIDFFRKEMCIAELSFLGSDLILRDTITILQVKPYNGQTINGVKYTLIDDFDGNGVPISAVSKDAFDSQVIMSADTLNKIQGVKSFKMSGLDVNRNSWSGGTGHNTLVEIKAAGKNLHTTNPDDVYINMWVYGSGKPNTGIEIKLYEIDNETNFNKIPYPGYTYQQDKNDAWIMDIPVTWKGWKLISKKYSNFNAAKDPAAGGGGNKIQEPHKLSAMGISLLSLPDPGASTSLNIDYVVITEGDVFIP